LEGHHVAKKETKEMGLTERLIMTMANDMAAAQRHMERVCIQFQALAESAGVNVANALIEE